MNKRQDLKIGMFDESQTTIAKYNSILNPVVNFLAYNLAYNTNLTSLKVQTEQQQYSKEGNTEDKKLARIKLITIAIESSNRLKAYSVFMGNFVLLAEIDFNMSLLDKLSANKLRDATQAIYDRIQSNLLALASYGATTITQTTFQTAIATFVAACRKPKVATNTQKVTTDKVDLLIKQTETSLNKIDTLVNMLRFSQPDLYKEYWFARKIGRIGTRYASVKAQLADLLTGQAIRGISVSFELDPTSPNYREDRPVFNKKSAEKGGFLIKNIPEGIYQVKAAKIGYKDANQRIVVNKDEMSYLNIKMEKIAMP